MQSPIASVLEQVASRSDEAFYDDVLLVDEQGSFLGMVFTRTLEQLQHRFLRESIERFKEKQREINAKNVNTTKRCVRYAAAGHPLPLHLRRELGLVERIGAGDNSRSAIRFFDL